MTADLLVGVDVGTTWCKAAAWDPATGRQLPTARRPTPWRGGEADAYELAGAAEAAIREAVELADAGAVAGIGIASMAEAGVLLDGAGRPLLPVIAWHDPRGADAATRLAAELPGFSERTGLPATAVLTICKHRELARGLSAARWLNVAEWVVRALGGEDVGELSLLSRTGYLDLASRRPSAAALAWAGMPPTLLPEPAWAGTPAGRCRLDFARAAVLTVAGHDHLAAAVGLDAVGDGDLLDSHGTAEALVRSVEPATALDQAAAAVAAGISVAWHASPGRMAMVGGFRSGYFLAQPGGRDRIDELAEQAASLKGHLDRLAGPAKRVVVTGGWARDPAVAAAKRRALGPYEQPAVEEAGCLGAARLALQALSTVATA